MKTDSIKTTFYDYLRIFFHRINYIALCMFLSLGAAGLYTFVIADEMYRAANYIYVTQFRNTALLSGLTKVSSLRDRLSLIDQAAKSEPSARALFSKLQPLAERFPGQADIQRESLLHLKGRLAGEPDNKYVMQAIQRAEENLRTAEARDGRAAKLTEALRTDPLNQEAAEELSRIQEQIEREQREIDGAIRSFQQNLHIRLLDNIIEVTYESTSPRIAKDVVDEVVEEVARRNTELQESEIGFAEKVYEDQVRRYVKDTQAARAALEGYAELYPNEYVIPIPLSADPDVNLEALDALPSQKNETLRTYQAIQQELSQVNVDIKGAQERVEQLKEQLKREPETVVAETIAQAPPEAQKARGQIGELQLQLSELLVDATEEHPLVGQTRRKIALLEEYLKRISRDAAISQKKVPNPVRQEILKQLQQQEAELPASLARQEALTARSILYRQKIREVPKRELDLEELRIDYLEKRKTLSMYRARLEQARINRQLEIEEKGTRFRVYGKAKLPFKAVRPDKRLYLILGFLVGMFSSGATVFFLEYTDHSIKGLEDAQRYLDIPILGAIPELGMQRKEISARFRLTGWPIWVIVVLIVAIAGVVAVTPAGRKLLGGRGESVFTERPLAATPTPLGEIGPAAASPAPEVRAANYIIVEEPLGEAE